MGKGTRPTAFPNGEKGTYMPIAMIGAVSMEDLELWQDSPIKSMPYPGEG
jgi:hypothetical protein